MINLYVPDVFSGWFFYAPSDYVGVYFFVPNVDEGLVIEF